MRILIVGGGAVGTVYGRHLQRGGADVHLMVRERQADAWGQGATLWRLGGRRPAGPELFVPSGVLTGPGEAARLPWDQVWLCVSSPALRGEWLPPLLAAVGGATIVSITPGLDDAPFLAERCNPARLVVGVAALVAFPTPLPGEAPAPPGLAYWFPPFSRSLFDGPAPARPALQAIVSTLRRGGCPAAIRTGAADTSALASAVMLPLVTALAGEEWSLERLSDGSSITIAARAAREAMTITAARRGRRAPMARHLVRPGFLRRLARAAPRLVPFDLEAYLRFHFTKVGAQTDAMLAEFIAAGKRLGLPVGAIEEVAGKRSEAG